MRTDGLVQALIAIGFLIGLGVCAIGFGIYKLSQHVHIQFI